MAHLMIIELANYGFLFDKNKYEERRIVFIKEK